MTLRLIITGGTFDKEYNEIDGTLSFRDTHLSGLLQLGRCKLPITLEKLMLIDSLDMQPSHRAEIEVACRVSPEQQIVITHGTDTMVDTAHVLARAQLNKTIVLTGAMIPIAFGSSDGLFNLGSAIAFAQSLPTGVYVSMNGRYFNWDNVRKNKTRGEFEQII
jgi:L-asparaginase